MPFDHFHAGICVSHQKYNQADLFGYEFKINPNGRIPAITDKGFNVIETSAILLYLTAEYDKDHLFGADPSEDRKQYSEELQWLFFVVGVFPIRLTKAIVVNESTYHFSARGAWTYSRPSSTLPL